ncbi:MAG: hypothetical protein R3314_04670 [Longimicrobiales bacterium]|nr:hypothetical protein [Longimicrobiales bacterium]
MAARGLLGAALLLTILPALAVAQDRSCRQVLPSDARRLFNAQGQELIYFRDPVRVLCTGGLRLEADSAVMNRTTSTVELVGDVVYRDSLRQLTADWANYLGGRSQLLARGSVVLRHLQDGSVVQGEELDYLQATEMRPLARMLVRGGRPYAVIPPQPDTMGEAADTAASTEVWADRMVFVGEDVFRGLGDVEIRRGEMTGAADTAVFSQASETMTLTGRAHVQTDRYRLDGREITGRLAGRQLETVTSVGRARIESEELTVDSERIRIAFAEGELDRLEAWNPEAERVPRALADAGEFRLRADSIDARADSVGIEEVRAVGRAYGERGLDTTAVRVADVISRDWIQGDTILSYFGRRPVIPRTRPVRDTTRVTAGMAPEPEPGLASGDSIETVLERIVVIGGAGPALSLYRMRSEDGEPPSVNFLKAASITLFMNEGDVSRVDADGPLDGVYLAPARRGEEEAAPEEGGGGDEPSDAAGRGPTAGAGGPAEGGPAGAAGSTRPPGGRR